MFLGELCCFPMYAVKLYIEGKAKNKALEEGAEVMLSPGTKIAQKKDLPTNINPLWLAIPASCDFCGSSLMMISLTMVPASVYQMMRGIIVVITALLSVIFLKRKQYRHHILGIILIVLGVGEVGLVAIFQPADSDTTGSVALGILLLIVS